jgi:hypothetical protein
MAIGTGDHVSVSLVDHEVGHALEVLDDMAARPDWQAIMRRSRPLLVIDRYQDAQEWWAEAWALCSTGHLAQLVRMLSGDEIAAEMTWAYYRLQYPPPSPESAPRTSFASADPWDSSNGGYSDEPPF